MAEPLDERQKHLRQALREYRSRLASTSARLADAVWNKEEDPLTHVECRRLLPKYVEAEIDGQDVVRLFPEVKHHLDRCDECATEYIGLLDLAQAAQEEPLTVQMPASALLFLDPLPVRIRKQVQQWAGQVVAAVAVNQEEEFNEIAEEFFEWVDALGGKIFFQNRRAGALGFGGTESGPAVEALALTNATAQQLVTTLTAAELDRWVRAGTVAQEIQARTLQAAGEIGLDPKVAAPLAHALARAVASDPTTLNTLLETK